MSGRQLKLGIEPSTIKNKAKRIEVYAKYKVIKAKLKAQAREKRKQEAEALGEAAPPKQVGLRSILFALNSCNAGSTNARQHPRN